MTVQTNEICGLRLISHHDISNPFQPQEVAHFVPPLTEGASSVGINDVHVDKNGIIYLTDRIKGGLYILELAI